MRVLKAFRYRLYPTPEQEELFLRTAGACRFIYNLCLYQQNLEWHRSAPRRITSYDQIKELTALKAEASWLKNVPHHPLCQTVVDLDKAYKNFFEGRAAYPKFRKRGDRDSFRYPDPKQFKIGEDSIFLPKAGGVSWVMHRPIPDKAVPKTATVSREADRWFVSIQCEIEIADPLSVRSEAIGIDMGVSQPMTLSTGEVIDLPKTTRWEMNKLATLQRTVARRKKGSANHRKAKVAVARFRAALARRRKDAAHKATTRLAKSHSRIVIEDLKVRNMTASAAGTVDEPGKNVRAKSGLNRSMLDIAPYQIREMLAYKTEWYGSTLVAVPPQYTSQRCSSCGHVHKDNRVSQSQFLCLSCGYMDNADVNAAKNILTRGLPGLACESNRAGGRKQEGSAARQRSSALQGRE